MFSLSAAASVALIAVATEVIAHGLASLPRAPAGPARRAAGFGRAPAPLAR